MNEETPLVGTESDGEQFLTPCLDDEIPSPSNIIPLEPTERPGAEMSISIGSDDLPVEVEAQGNNVNLRKIDELERSAEEHQLVMAQRRLQQGPKPLISAIDDQLLELLFKLSHAAQSGDSLLLTGLLYHPQITQIINTTHAAYGLPPLSLAALSGSAECVRLLLILGALPNIHAGHDGITPLHIAAGENHVDVVYMLIRGGAQVSYIDDNQCTPLSVAIHSGSTRSVYVILAQIAEEKKGLTLAETILICVHMPGVLITALELPVLPPIFTVPEENGTNSTQDHFEDFGSFLLPKDLSNQSALNTLFSCASFASTREAVSVLEAIGTTMLATGTVVAPSMEAAVTAIVLDKRYGFAQYGRNNLTLAAEFNRSEIMAACLYLCSPRDISDALPELMRWSAKGHHNRDGTPEYYHRQSVTSLLLIAAERHHKGQQLVDCADPIHGSTPLQLAALYGNVNTVLLLLRQGASLEAVDSYGRSAIDLARLRLDVFLENHEQINKGPGAVQETENESQQIPENELKKDDSDEDFEISDDSVQKSAEGEPTNSAKSRRGEVKSPSLLKANVTNVSDDSVQDEASIASSPGEKNDIDEDTKKVSPEVSKFSVLTVDVEQVQVDDVGADAAPAPESEVPENEADIHTPIVDTQAKKKARMSKYKNTRVDNGVDSQEVAPRLTKRQQRIAAAKAAGPLPMIITDTESDPEGVDTALYIMLWTSKLWVRLNTVRPFGMQMYALYWALVISYYLVSYFSIFRHENSSIPHILFGIGFLLIAIGLVVIKLSDPGFLPINTKADQSVLAYQTEPVANNENSTNYDPSANDARKDSDILQSEGNDDDVPEGMYIHKEDSFRQPVVALAELETILDGCPTCITKPVPRSKHSRFNNRCIGGFDHYCPWVNQDIGANNHRFFVVLLAVSTVTSLGMWLWSTIEIFFYPESIGLSRIDESHRETWKNVFSERPSLLYHIFVLPIVAVYLALLLLTQFRGIWTNLTQNEIINMNRYPEFNRNGKMYNPYDEGGAWANWVVFWTGKRRDKCMGRMSYSSHSGRFMNACGCNGNSCENHDHEQNGETGPNTRKCGSYDNNHESVAVMNGSEASVHQNGQKIRNEKKADSEGSDSPYQSPGSSPKMVGVTGFIGVSLENNLRNGILPHLDQSAERENVKCSYQSPVVDLE